MEPNSTSFPNPQLAQAVERLSAAELNRFADEIAALRARRNAPVLSADESALFAIINQSLTEAERMRLAALSESRANETLTLAEHQELLALQQKLESLHAARMKALADLATLRGVTLITMMEQLGIHFPDHT